jgi:WD40 repeat protein
VSALAFSADGKLLASGSGDQSARVWDVMTGQEIAICGVPIQVKVKTGVLVQGN